MRAQVWDAWIWRRSVPGSSSAVLRPFSRAAGDVQFRVYSLSLFLLSCLWQTTCPACTLGKCACYAWGTWTWDLGT